MGQMALTLYRWELLINNIQLIIGECCSPSTVTYNKWMLFTLNKIESVRKLLRELRLSLGWDVLPLRPLNCHWIEVGVEF